MTQQSPTPSPAGRSGPLSGIRVIEMAGIGPGPFAGMLMADLGADVIRIDRPGGGAKVLGIDPRYDCTSRGRRSLVVDLKHPGGVQSVKTLAGQAHALIEGYRPGVMERLGLGPDELLKANPALVYGRMTGWGQDGPLAQSAGHDLNYIALTGALHGIGRPGQAPAVPLNLIGDYGGGALYLAFGVVSALLHATRTGQGQVVDAAMCDGAASLMSLFYGMLAAGHWKPARGANMLDGGLPWYDTYETADGQHVAVGALEPKFYRELIERLGLDAGFATQSRDAAGRERLRAELARTFKTRTRDDWCRLLEGTDACFAPVLSMAEAPGHPHNQARGNFVEFEGVTQPAPAPRFSATPGRIAAHAPTLGEGGREALRDWGFDEAAASALDGVSWY